MSLRRWAGWCGLVLVCMLLTQCGRPVATPVPPTASPTATATPTATPTPTPTSPTIRVLLQDGLRDGASSSLQTNTSGQSSYRFTTAGYEMQARLPNLAVWSLAKGVYTTSDIRVTAMLESGPADSAMGLLVRYQNERNFYLFNVAANGFYNLERFDNGTWQTIITWTPSSAIRGEGQPNTLRVVTSGDRIGLFVNGTWLEEARDRSFSSGQVGLAVKTFERGGATVTFTNLLITGP